MASEVRSCVGLADSLRSTSLALARLAVIERGKLSHLNTRESFQGLGVTMLQKSRGMDRGMRSKV